MPTCFRFQIVFSLSMGILGMLIPQSGEAAEPDAPKLRAYVGAYTTGEGKGIYRFDFDPATGKATEPVLAAESVNPSFLAFNPTEEFLYAVNEVSDPVPGSPRDRTGWLTAYRVDKQTGELKELNRQQSGGAVACYVMIDSKTRNAVVANYTGGNVSCIPLREDGSVGPQVHTVNHGETPELRKKAKAHSIVFSPDERFAIAGDAGLDELRVYRFDAESGTLTPHEPHIVPTGPKSAARHVTFHPNGKWAYNNNEADFKINAFDYDAANGRLTMRQTLSTLDDNTEHKGSTAEVLVHPSGKFVYVSNRGPDSIAIYHIDENGQLTFQGTTSTQGKTPRNFRIDPTGQYLLAANQESSNIVIFKIDPQTGALNPTGTVLEIPNPICIKFARIP